MSIKSRFHFYAVEKITIAYILITWLILLCMRFESYPVQKLIHARTLILCVIFGLTYLSSKFNLKFIRFVRFLFVGALLSYWYPETYEFNRHLPNCDHILSVWEQYVFGCQPAILFAKTFPQAWLCEIFNLGYFSYYPLIIGSSLIFLFKERLYFEKFFFKLMFSFFVFYLIYILFPTSGPQYYFTVIGEKAAMSGVFPRIGDYFNNHSVSIENCNVSGIFQQMVEYTQKEGERPTAAFPSSHVGISTLIMIMLFDKRKYIAGFMILPLYIALVFATVYIQAHFVIDVIAGFVCAFVLNFVSSKAYDMFVVRQGTHLLFSHPVNRK